MIYLSSSLKHIAVMGIVWGLRLATVSSSVSAFKIDTCPSEVITAIWPIREAFIPALGLWCTSFVMAGFQSSLALPPCCYCDCVLILCQKIR